jgi:hypothetical protein
LQGFVVEASPDRRLDDVEIGRDVEVARAVQRGVANFEDLLERLHAAHHRDLRQDRIAHGAESVGDQRRANQPRRIARAERDHAPPPALRQRHRQQIAQQVDDVLQVVGEADARDGIGAHRRAVRLAQPHRPADAGVKPDILRQRRGDDALADIGFNQNMRFAVRRGAACDRSDIERRMRPRRLREIFDDAGNVVVALDQKHVAGFERLEQCVRIARRERLVAAHRLLQIAGDQPPEAIEHHAHRSLPANSRGFAASFIGALFEVRCILVHTNAVPLTET